MTASDHGGLWLLLSLLLLILALAGVVIHLVLALTRERRRGERLEGELRALRDDLGALCSGAVGVSERVARIEQHQRRLTERQDQLEMSSTETRPYENAIGLVHKGADVETLVAQCGLTRGEAELVVMMHRMDKG